MGGGVTLTRTSAEPTTGIDEAHAKRQADRLQQHWSSTRPVPGSEARFLTELVRAANAETPQVYDVNARTWLAGITRRTGDTIDAAAALALRYSPDSDLPRGAEMIGVWVAPHAHGKGLVYKLYTDAFRVAEAHAQTTFRRRTRPDGGPWVEHLIWLQITDGLLELPAPWRYVPGASDKLISRDALDAHTPDRCPPHTSPANNSTRSATQRSPASSRPTSR